MTKRDDSLAQLGILDADLVAPTLLHELKQPIMGADATARLLERRLAGTLLAEADWATLRTQIDRLGEIVLEYESLLRPNGAPVRYDVGEVVARSVALLSHRTRPLARRFALQREDGASLGYGAPAALVHAATNVLANALDAVDGAPGEPRVQVRVLRGREGLEVRISDEGAGVPAAVRPRLFEPRFTTKPPGRGNGLGLHLARRLMEREGGAVYLVPDADPARLPWAVTEFCIAVPAPPGGAP